MSHPDLEKCASTPPPPTNAASSANNKDASTTKFYTNMMQTACLFLAYAFLYITNEYLSPGGPVYQDRKNDPGRISPLTIVLMLLGPEVIQKTFAVTSTAASATGKSEIPCFGFGWLAYSMSLLLSMACGSGDIEPKPECEVKVVDITTEKTRSNKSFSIARLIRDLEVRYAPDRENSELVIDILEPTGPPRTAPTPTKFTDMLQSRSVVTGFVQYCIAAAFWYYYSDLSAYLLLSTSVLLAWPIAVLPAWTTQKPALFANSSHSAAYAIMRETESKPTHIYIIKPSPPTSQPSSSQAVYAPALNILNTTAYIPTTILIAGGFFSQALLYTQLSDNAAFAMLLIMFIGTMGNLAIVATPRVPCVDGVELKSVGVMRGEGALKEVDVAYKGWSEVLRKLCFAEMVRKCEGDGEEKVGDMD
jgi:hypothetical protein